MLEHKGASTEEQSSELGGGDGCAGYSYKLRTKWAYTKDGTFNEKDGLAECSPWCPEK